LLHKVLKKKSVEDELKFAEDVSTKNYT
jgi:hypothetical protein